LFIQLDFGMLFGQIVDVDESRWLQNIEFHQVQDGCSACQIEWLFSSVDVPARNSNRRRDICGTLVDEWEHQLTPFHGRFRLINGIDDVRTGGASTQITAYIFAVCRLIARVAFFDTGHRGHDLPRRTIAALKDILINERLLHRMQLSVRRHKTLDGENWAADTEGKRQAGEHQFTINVNGAGTALAVITAFFCASQSQFFA
jgi:hypothetical protein